MSKVDGALILSPDGSCHAFGAILDGRAVRAGSRSRGARFNSALRYVYGGTGRLALVHSEDGHVDLFPRLRPRARRSELERELATLRAAGRGDVVTPDLQRIAERLDLYKDVLSLAEDDQMLVFHFMNRHLDIFGEEPPRPAFDPHQSDVLAEDSPEEAP